MNDRRAQRLQELLNSLNITDVEDLIFVDQALIHPSYIYEGNVSAAENNQRLEFLGDAVVGLITAHYLFAKCPKKSEGQLTRIRAAVVCEASLAEAAQSINLGKYLLMGKGEGQMGGAKRSSNLADCFEAFVGALYLTIGLEKTRSFVLTVMKNRIKESVNGSYNDFKTRLQEIVQKKPENRVTYKIFKEEGPDHEKVFYAAVYLNDNKIAHGSGHTKKEAEQKAAQLALQELGEI